MIRATASKQQLNQLTTALEQYKLKYGEYPPDGNADEATVKRHILKRWPQILKSGTINDCRDKLFKIDEDTGKYVLRNPEQMLTFWLIGPTRNGFSADVSDPFNLSNNPNIAFITPLLELSSDNYDDEKGILIDKNGQWIAYFRADNNHYDNKKLYMPITTGDSSEHTVAVPYMKNEKWYHSDSYQLILAGEDGLFGEIQSGAYNDLHDDRFDDVPVRDLADRSTYKSADLDNIANFTEGATLESEIE